MLSLRQLLAALATLPLFAFLIGCASVGAPLPPSLQLLKPPTDLRAVRKGDRVYLSWTVPSKTMDRQSVRHRGVTLVCRSTEVIMASCGTPVGSVAPEATPKDAAANAVREPATFADQIQRDLLFPASRDPRNQNAVPTVTYAVETLNTSDRSAGLSNQVQVLLAPTVPPPKEFHAELTAEGVRLTWPGELWHLRPSPVNYFYRAYRRLEGSQERTVIGQVVVGMDAHPSVLDQSFAWEKHYEYWLNIVTDVQTGRRPCPTENEAFSSCMEHSEIEGDDTPFVPVFTHDIYPPAVPTGLQAVFSGPGQRPFVDLLWAPNTDADLAGYHVFRREEGTEFTRIDAELVKAPAYRDSNVVSGKTYWYSVSAVDLRGNESARSEAATESVP